MVRGLPDPAYPSPLRHYVGQVLQEWREARAWTRTQLQRATGIWHTTIRAIEEGRSGGTTDRLDRLSIALGHDIAALFAEAHRRRRQHG